MPEIPGCFQDDRIVSDEASGTKENSVGCSDIGCKTNDEGIGDGEMDDILMYESNGEACDINSDMKGIIMCFYKLKLFALFRNQCQIIPERICRRSFRARRKGCQISKL